LGYRHQHDNFDPAKDVVIPPYVDLTDAMEWLERRAKLQPPSGRYPSGKKFLAYFRGTVHDDERYSHGVRQALVKHYANHTDIYVRTEHASVKTVYYAELHSSVFCLCPGGWSPWSPRLFECIAFGAIPVVFDRDIKFPFETSVDYNKIVLHIVSHQMDQLESFLRQALLNTSDIIARQDYMKSIRSSFVWSNVKQCPDMNPFCLLLHSL
jgi:hypothetical protein